MQILGRGTRVPRGIRHVAPTVPREGRPQPFQLESHMAAYTAYAVYAAYIAQIGRPPCHFFSQRAQGIPRKSPAYLNSSEIYKIAFKSSGYANMRPPQACKAKSQQPSRNPRFALDPLLLPTKESHIPGSHVRIS